MPTYYMVVDGATGKELRGAMSSKAQAQKEARLLRKGIHPIYGTSVPVRSHAKVVSIKHTSIKSNPIGIPVGKFLPARLNKDGSVSFVVEKGKHKGARKVNPQRRVKNIADGFYANGVFHPIRHGEKAAAKGIDDYRPEALSGPEGSRARSGIRKATRKKAKKAVRKTAKKTTRRATKKTAKRKR